MVRASVRAWTLAAAGVLCLYGLLSAVRTHAQAYVYEESTAAPSTSPAPTAVPPSASALLLPPPVEESWGKTQVLGGHRFLRSSFVPSALVFSHVGVRAGLEYHSVPGYAQLPSLVDSDAQPVNLRTVNVAETIDFSVRLHDYVALFGDVYGKARIGANTATLLGVGVDYTYGGDLGVLIKLFRYGGFQLSASGQAGYYAGQGAGVMALFQDLSLIARNTIEEVQNDPDFDTDRAISRLNRAFRTATADLLTPFDGFSYGFSVNAAQALGRYFGLQAALGFYADLGSYQPTRYDPASGGPRTREYSLTTMRPAFALALDFDANPARIPLAVLVEYRMTPTSVRDTGGNVSPSNEDEAALGVTDASSVEHLLAVGLYYSGRADLQLGITGYTLFGQIPMLGANAMPSGSPTDLALQLVFRYFW